MCVYVCVCVWGGGGVVVIAHSIQANLAWANLLLVQGHLHVVILLILFVVFGVGAKMYPCISHVYYTYMPANTIRKH